MSQQQQLVEVIEIGAWRTGFHAASGKVVLIFEFSDRKPIAVTMAPATANELGASLQNKSFANKN